MPNLECSDCGSTRKRTRIINGDILCGTCEGDRKDTIFYMTLSKPGDEMGDTFMDNDLMEDEAVDGCEVSHESGFSLDSFLNPPEVLVSVDDED